MRPFLLAAVCLLPICALRADEGMWLFSQPPRNQLHARYQFDISDDWLSHLQKSSVRVGSGGSASFVSGDGLIISNHHVGSGSLQKLSNAQTNYLRDGFYAPTLAQEIKCLDLEVNVLVSTEDVTARVNAAVPKDASAEAAFEARRKVIAAIQKESQDQTGLRSDVVTLWEGGAYQLYRYKHYTDVRLVFAPEQQIAFYGGDPDNFEYPRYDLDICFFRVYENGRPANTKDFLKFSPTGAQPGDLVFVSGHPGHTSRSFTMADLIKQRDVDLPFNLNVVKEREVLLSNWSERSTENARRARQNLFGVQNTRKRDNGLYAGLLDPDLMAAKARDEADFKVELAGKPELADALSAYDKIVQADKVLGDQPEFLRMELLESAIGFDSECFGIARTLLRAGDERPKPDGERLLEFSDSNKASLELGLFSPKPIYSDLEILKLTDSLNFLAEELGGDDPLVQRILAGKSPHERASELINDTKVRDVAFRHRLYDGGASAVKAANDPMIELARLIDPEARAARKVYETQLEIIHQANAAIAAAKIKFHGTAGYPDATFTLRLAYGTVKGDEEDGQAIPPTTDFAGLYARAETMKDRAPYDLPQRWLDRKSDLNLSTPLNFVSTCDIIGGNSGSPVVNRQGEFVGIIFDGNLASLPWNYAYSDKQGRAVSVESSAILQALDKVYDAKNLVNELMNGRRSD